MFVSLSYALRMKPAARSPMAMQMALVLVEAILGHDGGVRHAQALDAVYPQLRIDHRLRRVGADAATTHRVVGRRPHGPDVRDQGLVTGALAARSHFFFQHRPHRCRRGCAARRVQASQTVLDIVRMGEVLRQHLRVSHWVAAPDVRAAARARGNFERGQGDAVKVIQYDLAAAPVARSAHLLHLQLDVCIRAARLGRCKCVCRDADGGQRPITPAQPTPAQFGLAQCAGQRAVPTDAGLGPVSHGRVDMFTEVLTHHRQLVQEWHTGTAQDLDAADAG